MNHSIRVRLCILMFFQYFIWGAWYVTMGTYLVKNLGANGIQIGSAYANLSIAAIISPFFVGLIADRFFSAQKVLGVLHLLGAILLYYMSTVQDFSGFWWLVLVYTLLYMPTISLSNAIAFRNIENPGKNFPAVRVLGTVGWIVAGLLISLFNLENSRSTFHVASASSIILGVFSFFLPATPSAKKSADITSILGLDALVLFRSRSFSVFFFASVMICIPLAFYYGFANPFLNDAGLENVAGKMTLGQASEIVFMFCMPLLFLRLGVKKMLLIGMCAWAARYMFFSYAGTEPGNWMLYAGIILHGICYDFFFVTGQIYIDSKAGESVKSAAQGLITFATYGVGMMVGSYVAGFLAQYYAFEINDAIHYNWQSIWLIPAVIAVVVMIVFYVFFHEEKTIKKTVILVNSADNDK